jgi:hypothetical protein
MSAGSFLLLASAVALAALGQQSAASPFGVKLAAAPHAGAVATSAATTAELKKHAVSGQRDRGKRAVAPASPLMGLQMGAGMFPGAVGAGSKLDDNDPAAAMTRMIAPEDVPTTNANGTVVDSGEIGADGKRTGKLAAPPDFTFPIVLASVTSVIMVIYFTYACCFQKDEPRKKGDSYM